MSEVGRRHQDTRPTNAREGFPRVCIHEEEEEEEPNRVGRGYVHLKMKDVIQFKGFIFMVSIKSWLIT